MPDSRITLTTDELARTIAIWLSLVGQRRPALVRELWTRRGERPDQERRQHARHELARFLAEQMRVSRFEVTRQETLHDRLRADAGEPDA